MKDVQIKFTEKKIKLLLNARNEKKKKPKKQKTFRE